MSPKPPRLTSVPLLYCLQVHAGPAERQGRAQHGPHPVGQHRLRPQQTVILWRPRELCLLLLITVCITEASQPRASPSLPSPGRLAAPLLPACPAPVPFHPPLAARACMGPVHAWGTPCACRCRPQPERPFRRDAAPMFEPTLPACVSVSAADSHSCSTPVVQRSFPPLHLLITQTPRACAAPLSMGLRAPSFHLIAMTDCCKLRARLTKLQRTAGRLAGRQGRESRGEAGAG